MRRIPRLRTGLTGLCALLLTATAATPARAGWGVGNGGDEVGFLFDKAQQHAALVTLRLQERSLPLALNPAVRDWLIANHTALSADISLSPHVPVYAAQPTCAWTVLAAAAPVELSYPTCRASVASFDDAAQLLVHESVHHFGIGDEAFADAVAIAVYDSWRQGTLEWTPTAAAPPPASQSSAVWTGQQMLVFGGLDGSGTATNAGYAYDPVADAWAALATAGAPARFNHQAIWTGRYMIIWGGYVARAANVKVWQNSGALWDSVSNTWQALATPAGPAELADLSVDQRSVQTLVWTGTEAIIFGGAPLAAGLPGGIYNPATRTWRAVNPRGAPGRITGHSAVWADDRMLVWGGLDLGRNATNTGAAYDPASDRWTPLPAPDALSPRDGHSAVWTGSAMIVFGGMDSVPDFIGTGALYDVAKNAWTPIRTESVQARVGHTAVWTGSEMLVFGGKSKKLAHTYFNAVSAFSPASGTWRIVESRGAPAARCLHTAVWTGNSMITFGGVGGGDAALGSGGVFYP